jgi:hypothetical protein
MAGRQWDWGRINRFCCGVKRKTYRSSFVKTILIGTAAIGALMLGLNAYASCADPRIKAEAGTFEQMPGVDLQQMSIASPLDEADAGVNAQNASQAIVGTWLAVYTPDGSSTPNGKAFIQWHGDFTEWENIDYPVLGGNICMGSWKPVDQSHVSRNHFGWLYNNQGNLAGYFNESETDELASDGRSYTGTNTTVLHFFGGGAPITMTGTATAHKIVR